MISGFLKKFYGNFSRDELKKFSILATIFAFTIGVYWLLRPIKSGVFCSLVGPGYLWLAKIVSLVVIFPLAIFYSKLSNKYSKDKLFYVLSAVYGLLAIGFYFGLMNPNIGLPNTAIGAHRWIGWMWYVFVESFGSIMVVTFWSFAADTTTPESAKRGYPLLAMGGQVGGMAGPFVAMKAKSIGTGPICLIAAIAILAIIPLIKFFMYVVPQDQLKGYESKGEPKAKKSKPGFFEGLRLLVSEPYLLGIFAVISIFEVIVTIFDFQFQTMAYAVAGGADSMTAYMGKFGMFVNGVALINLIFGINNIGRKLGLTVSLVAMPVLISVAVIMMYFSPTLGTAFWVMVISKGINYALGQPSKEQLYVPTSKDTKYKAKGWIEMFGSRGSKAFGSVINSLYEVLAPAIFMLASTGISFGLIALWIMTALYLGKTHKKAVDTDSIVC